jgi:acyl-CoA synthetase (NDP forming)
LSFGLLNEHRGSWTDWFDAHLSVGVADIIQITTNEGREILTEVESKELLGGSGLPIERTRLATSQKEAVAISMDVGLPVVLKIVSPQVIQKRDIGVVKTGLKGRTDVGTAYSEGIGPARRNGASQIHGVSIQPLPKFLEGPS